MKIDKNKRRPFKCDLSITFDNREQRDCFLSMLMKEDIIWDYDVESDITVNQYVVSIYSLRWGGNLKRLGELLEEIDGSFD